MRIVVLFILGLLGVSAEPLISVGTVSDMVKTSVSLSLDLAKFSSNKVEEALPLEARKHYAKFTLHAQEYSQMVQNFVVTNPLVARVTNAVGTAYAVAANTYERANAQSAKIIDPVVHEFEKRYPASAGLIGESLLDRMLVALWLIWFIKTTARLSMRLLGCKSCSMGKRNI
jgi:hypothetical protein